MVNVILEVILNNIEESDIEMVYFKGSAEKEWDSPVDYVPEMSDVDIHIQLKDDSFIEKYFNSVKETMEWSAEIEKIYLSQIKNPVHLPRPQIMILNKIMKDENFIPTPCSSVRVIFGKDYPEPVYPEDKVLRDIDSKRILEAEDFIERLPLRLIDRPGSYLRTVLREMTWRVSPCGPRVLSLLGMGVEEAWSINRTRIISTLRKYGNKELAEHYTDFYLHGWDYFLSNYKNSDAGRKVLLSGLKVLESSIDMVK